METNPPNDQFNIQSLLFLLLVLFVFVVYSQHFSSDQYLTLIQAIAWPLSVLIVGMFFREELAAFLGRVTNAKLPGGIELQASQPPLPSTELVESISSGTENDATEFPSLNTFLVGNSKGALKWFSEQVDSVTQAAFLVRFPLPFPPPSSDPNAILAEKLAVVTALTNTGMIEATTLTDMRISLKGKRFLKFINV